MATDVSWIFDKMLAFPYAPQQDGPGSEPQVKRSDSTLPVFFHTDVCAVARTPRSSTAAVLWCLFIQPVSGMNKLHKNEAAPLMDFAFFNINGRQPLLLIWAEVYINLQMKYVCSGILENLWTGCTRVCISLQEAFKRTRSCDKTVWIVQNGNIIR